MAFCAGCGRELTDDARFCRGCGRPTEPKKAGYSFLIVGTLCALVPPPVLFLAYEATVPTPYDESVSSKAAAPTVHVPPAASAAHAAVTYSRASDPC